MDNVFLVLNFCCEDADHIIIAIILLLFTNTPTKIQKMHYMFMYIYK